MECRIATEAPFLQTVIDFTSWLT
ncbi:Protein of unknown function [Pyronema omphalodes CBS 100304]|uniref:Uncharacterized protein n=1 Tax=Pyronema omphalodes (strain CBS 100304) TaxID=1076935 RepID=U4L3T9_PYROM|nr:Protein of unknown function [Pyronema omphalodes CBS 100304]